MVSSAGSSPPYAIAASTTKGMPRYIAGVRDADA